LLPVAMVTKIWEFLYKICCNSAYIKYITKNSAPNTLFEVGQFNDIIDIYIGPTPVAMVTKIWEF